jgi:hypothetical protein
MIWGAVLGAEFWDAGKKIINHLSEVFAGFNPHKTIAKSAHTGQSLAIEERVFAHHAHPSFFTKEIYY